jgi:Xaa-Pro aminopeptidase
MKRVPEPANDFMEGFSKWLESEDGQHSMEAVDYVFEALRGADLDIAGRRIVWADGQKLTIDQSVKKIYEQTGMNVEAIRSHIIGWLELEYEPKGLDDEQMELFESQINAWIDEYGNSLIK